MNPFEIPYEIPLRCGGCFLLAWPTESLPDPSDCERFQHEQPHGQGRNLAEKWLEAHFSWCSSMCEMRVSDSVGEWRRG